MAREKTHWTINELADEAGVSWRTLRRLVSVGAIPGLGQGGGARADSAYRTRALAAVALRKQGIQAAFIGDRLDAMSPEELHRTAGVPFASKPVASESATAAPTTNALWVRVPVMPGVELHVAVGALSASALEAITSAVRSAAKP